MRTFLSALAVVLNAGAAFAHPSVVPHEHPHAVSVLPDVMLLAVAALMIGFGVVVIRKYRKE
jgi:hypothetical protein